MNQEEAQNVEHMFVFHKGKIDNKGESQQVQPCKPRNRAPALRESTVIIEEVQNMRISSEWIVNQEGSNLALAQSITCPVCLNLFTIPYQECQSCSNGFCGPCIESWWAKEPGTCIYKCQKAEFKQIKRSNTFNALIQTLKVQCDHCKQDQPVANLNIHILKHCLQVKQICRFCAATFPRKQIQKHEAEECPERVYDCKHCSEVYLFIEEELHEATCDFKLFECCHEKCEKMIQRKYLKTHQQNCGMQIVQCKWCESKMTKRQNEEHDVGCQKKILPCSWCRESFGMKELMEHQCQKRKQICRLCESEVLASQMERHKIECMFENMVEIKQKNGIVGIENQRLKEKISLLEGIIEQTVESRQSNTMKVLREMREQDIKMVEKDLLRIDNSIRSVEKLKKQETNAHMKYPHLIQTWCPFCRELEKRFKAMLDPLLMSRKHTLQKLAEFQRFGQTPH